MKTSFAVALTLAFLPLSVNFVPVSARATRLVFEGTLLRVAPEPKFVSGDTVVYRLAKYRVNRVCVGRYTSSLIVVDHLVLSGNELQNVKPGEEVCVSVTRRENVGARYEAEGIRAPNDIVKVFYVGGEVQKIEAKAPCSCSDRHQ